MTTKTIIERPEGTHSKSYTRYKSYIIDWRKKNKEYVVEYNKLYQRKLRKDPVKYNELRMRIIIRNYLTGRSKNSFKSISAIGMTRSEIAAYNGMTEAQLMQHIKNCEIDHIISSNWFNNEKNIHLKPFMYKYYNLQFVERLTNRQKHKFVDENDIRVQLVLTRLQLDYYSSINKYNEESYEKIASLSKLAKSLQRRVQNKYKV